MNFEEAKRKGQQSADEILAKKQIMAANGEDSFTPREYQVELLEKAIKKNIVVCLGTGSGKTFIAVMLIKEMMESIRKPFKEGGKRTFFLAKTVPLVAQQAIVIRDHTGLKVGHYTGSMNVDAWDINVWLRELENNEVLVMTTQILVNMLNMAFIRLDQINLLIFDECHHAVGGDPIVQVMQNFSRFPECSHPKVLGLTASVLNGKCKPNQILNKIRQLEVRLHSVIETPTNTAMAILFSTNPKELFVTCKEETEYDRIKLPLCTYILAELKKLPNVPSEKDLVKFAMEIDEDDDDYEEDQSDEADFDDEDDYKYIIGPTLKLSRLLKDLIFSVKELGLWCTWTMAKQMLQEMDKLKDDFIEQEKAVHFESVKKLISSLVPNLEEYFDKQAPQGELQTIMKLSSPKVIRLVESLKNRKPKDVTPIPALADQKAFLLKTCGSDSEAVKDFDANVPISNEFKAIVFVERRSCAWVINKLLQRLKELNEEYNFIASDFVMGHGADPAKLNYAQMKSRKQQEKISKFRLNECNLLVATRVVEEGMDIPTCNLVIRFDEPKDFRAYVQSKGRARAKNGNYVMLVTEANHQDLRSNIDLYRSIEESLQAICKERMAPTRAELERFYDREIEPYYTRGLTGPVVTMESAIQLVNRYCASLPRDKFTRLTTRVKYQKTLPHRPPLEEYGDDNIDLWEDLDVLISNVTEGMKYEFRCILWLPINSGIRHGIKSDVMRTIRLAKQDVAIKCCKLLHQKGEISDDLLPTCKDYSKFTDQLTSVEEEIVPKGCNQPGSMKRRQVYRKKVAQPFGKSPLPKAPCFLYRIKISLGGLLGLGIGEIKAFDPAKCAHCFGIITSTELPKINPFPLFNQTGKHWVEIIELEGDIELPEEHLEKIAMFHQTFFTEILRINSLPMEFNPLQSGLTLFVIPITNVGDGVSPVYFPNWDLIEETLNFEFGDLPSENERRNFQYNPADYVDRVMAPLYVTHKPYYLVKRVLNGIHPTHEFPKPTYNSFVDYYKRKYNVTIQNLAQCLLSAKLVSSNGMNMLPIKVERTKKKQKTIYGQLFDTDTFLIPELCTCLPIPGSLFRLGFMIPSIIYRLNDLILCHELLDTISNETRSYRHLIPELVPQLRKRPQCIQTFRDHAIENTPNWNIDYNREHQIPICTQESSEPTPNIILNALTTRAANDCLDLERLEFLGDSFLKYVTTLFLFCQFPDADEGRLTSGRSKLISNSHLYHLAKAKGLSNLVKVEIFSPASKWLPPGFVMNRQAEAKLIDSGVPFYAWESAVNCDMTNLNDGAIWSMVIRYMKQHNIRIKNDEGVVNVGKDDNVYNEALNQQTSDKSTADAIEAIIGAFLLHSGPEAAVRFLTWLGFNVFQKNEIGEQIPFKFPTTAVLNPRRSLTPKLLAGLDVFETEIGYVFKDKSFLVQALTHPSYFRNQVTECYQRLEFLGDAILDYLIVWYLYKDPKNHGPGKLSDMKSALVNNITFANLAVKHKYNRSMNALSPPLFTAISRFCQMVEKEKKNILLMWTEEDVIDEEEVEVPKALGDIFESVAGAIYLDSGCSLDEVWKVYYPIMRAVIEEYSTNTPKTPVREVYEMFPDVQFSRARPLPKNEDDEENDPQRYFVVVRMGAKTFKGVGNGTRVAKINAAKCVLRFFKRHPSVVTKFGGLTLEEQTPLTLDEIFKIDDMD